MFLYGVADGRTYDVSDLPGDTTVLQLMTYLAGPVQVDPANQILICNGEKLDPKRLVSSYPPDAKVFLFNRVDLSEGAVPPGPVIPVSVIIPDTNQSLPTVPTTVLEPARAAYTECYQNFQRAKALHEAGNARFQWCRQCVAEQYVQSDGLGTAMANLSGQRDQLMQQFKYFSSLWEQQSPQHKELLDNFEDDLARLEDNILPSSVTQATGAATLKNLVPEAPLRNWHEECGRMHTHMTERVQGLEAVMSTVLASVKKEEGRGTEVNFSMLETELAEAESTLDDERNILASIQADLEYISSPERTAADLPTIEEKLRLHRTQSFPSLFSCDQMLSRSVEACATSKTHLSESVFHRIRTIAQVQTEIRDLAQKLTLFQHAMKKKSTQFAQLYYTKKMPAAYRMFLHEVVRRHDARNAYLNHLSQIGERMAKLREREVTAREAFTKRYAKYLPAELFGLLNESPPYLELQAPKYDTNLPDVEVSDIDALCSEPAGALRGSLSSNFGTASTRSISSAAGDSSKGGDTSIDLSTNPLLQSIVRRAELSRSRAADSVSGGGDLDVSLHLDQIEATLRESTSKDAKIRTLKEQVESFASERDAYQSRVRKLEEQLRVAFESSQNNTATSPSKASEEAEAKVKEAAQQCEEMKSELSQLRDQLNEANANEKRASERANSVQERFERMTAQVNEMSEEFEQTRADLKAVRTQEERSQVSIAGMVSEREELVQSLSDATKMCEAHAEELRSAQVELEAARARVSELEAAGESEKESSQEVSDLLAKLTDKSREYETQAAQIADLTRARDELLEHVAAAQASEKEAESAREAETAEKTRLETTLATASTERDQLRRDLEAARSEVESRARAQADASESQTQVEQLRKEKNAAISEVASLHEETIELRDELAKKDSVIDETRQKLDVLSVEQSKASSAGAKQLDEMTRKLDVKVSEVSALKKDLDTAQATIQSSKMEHARQVESLQTEMAKLMSVVESSKTARNTLAEQLDASEVQVASAMKDAADWKAQVETAVNLSAENETALTSAQAKERESQSELDRIRTVLTRILDIVDTDPGTELSETPASRALTASDQDLDDLVSRVFLMHARVLSLSETATELESQLSASKAQISELTASGSQSAGSSPAVSADAAVVPASPSLSTLSQSSTSQHSRTSSGSRRKRRISFLSFSLGDVALFFPVPKTKNTYCAFNWKAPHHYLSPESLAMISQTRGEQSLPFVLGEVVQIRDQVATDDENPYALSTGTKYYVVDVSLLDGVFNK